MPAIAGTEYLRNQAALEKLNRNRVGTPGSGLAVNSPLLTQAVSGLFKLNIGVQKSTNLIDFTPFPMTAPQTSINATGRLEFQFTSPTARRSIGWRRN